MANETGLEKGLAQLKDHEGFRSKVYLDSLGIETIGFGRNLKHRGITEDEGTYLLNNDVKDFIDKVQVKFPWVLQLNEPRLWVLYNMAFNMGLSGLSTFKNTLRAIEEGSYDVAADGMSNSRWAKQVKRRAVQLSEQMRTGEWPKEL